MLRSHLCRVCVLATLLAVVYCYTTGQAARAAQTPPAGGKSLPVPGKCPPVPGKGLPGGTEGQSSDGGQQWQPTDPIDQQLGAPPESPKSPPEIPSALAEDRP